MYAIKSFLEMHRDDAAELLEGINLICDADLASKEPLPAAVGRMVSVGWMQKNYERTVEPYGW